MRHGGAIPKIDVVALVAPSPEVDAGDDAAPTRIGRRGILVSLFGALRDLGIRDKSGVIRIEPQLHLLDPERMRAPMPAPAEHAAIGGEADPGRSHGDAE